MGEQNKREKLSDLNVGLSNLSLLSAAVIINGNKLQSITSLIVTAEAPHAMSTSAGSAVKLIKSMEHKTEPS